MAGWRTSSEPLEIRKGKKYFNPMKLEVEAGTGDVQIQRLKPDGQTWTTIEGEGTLSESGIYSIERRNSPPLRVIAIGDAKFKVWGQ